MLAVSNAGDLVVREVNSHELCAVLEAFDLGDQVVRQVQSHEFRER